ncbi:MAG: DUF3592 domain-containing protein [Spirochaetes bacterium]|nr:DUF3592 domain-containing protein [Spirochaetota bacterium]
MEKTVIRKENIVFWIMEGIWLFTFALWGIVFFQQLQKYGITNIDHLTEFGLFLGLIIVNILYIYWYRSLMLEFHEDYFLYRTALGGTILAKYKDIEKAYVQVGFNDKGGGRPLIRVEIEMKPESGVGNFFIKLAVFKESDWPIVYDKLRMVEKDKDLKFIGKIQKFSFRRKKSRKISKKQFAKKKVGYKIIIGMILTLLSIKSLYWVGSESFLSIKSEKWPHVQGIVNRQYPVLERIRGNSSHVPKIRYNYQVEGKMYVSEKIGFPNQKKTKSQLGEMYRKYQIGNSVDVFYNPEDPKVSCLEPGNFDYFFFFMIGSVGILFGLLGGFFLYQTLKIYFARWTIKKII